MTPFKIRFDNSIVIQRLVEDMFEIEAYYQQHERMILTLAPRYDLAKTTAILKERLKLAGYEFTLDSENHRLTLTINPQPALKIPPLNIILFFITLASVYFVPVFLKQLSVAMFDFANAHADSFNQALSFWQELKLTASLFTPAFEKTMTALAHGAGIEFTLALISILFVHEMGHFIASRRRHIITSWPFFIPAPNIIGTFGAVIKSKSPFWNRRDLIEVGAAGPIAGWILAVFWLWYGLSHSAFITPEIAPPGEMLFSLDGESILMKISTLFIIGPAPEGCFYHLTEAAFAGWVGLLVSAINLLPIGQLDGGHILYGLNRKTQTILGYTAMGVLLLLGLQSTIWWVFALFGVIFGIKHPPTLNDMQDTGKPAKIMGIIALLILVLSFTPVPFR